MGIIIKRARVLHFVERLNSMGIGRWSRQLLYSTHDCRPQRANAACHKLHTAHRTRYVEGKCHKRFGTECDDLKAKLIIMRIDSSKIDRYNKEEGIN